MRITVPWLREIRFIIRWVSSRQLKMQSLRNGLADRVDVQDIGRTSGNSETLISVDDKVIEKVERIIFKQEKNRRNIHQPNKFIVYN